MRQTSSALILGVALTALLAATPAAAERPLTYPEALEAAVTANPSMRRASLGVEQAEASVLGARGRFDPALSIDGAWRKSNSQGFFQGLPYKVDSRYWDFQTQVAGSVASGTSWSITGNLDRNISEYITEFQEGFETESLQDAFTSNLSFGVTQQLLRGLSLRYNLHTITRARDGLTGAELSEERSRQETLADAASAYWALWYQVRLVEIATQSVEIGEEALRVGSLRVESGDLAPVERTRLEAALVQAQSSELEARIAAQQAADLVLLLMGESPGQVLIPATAPGEAPALDLDEEAAVAVALSQNLDLAVVRASLDGARHDATFASHGVLPSLSTTVAAGVGAQEDSLGRALGGMFSDRAFPFLSISGQLSMPLGNRSARGESQRAAYALRAAEIDVEELERAIRSQVEHQVRTLRSARRKIELAEINLRLAEETLEAEVALADAGRSIQKDVLEARAAVHRARVEAAKARMDYRLAKVELLRLQGQLEVDR